MNTLQSMRSVLPSTIIPSPRVVALCVLIPPVSNVLKPRRCPHSLPLDTLPFCLYPWREIMITVPILFQGEMELQRSLRVHFLNFTAPAQAAQDFCKILSSSRPLHAARPLSTQSGARSSTRIPMLRTRRTSCE